MKLLKSSLYELQAKAARLALSKGSFAFLMEPGTGKTITALKVTAVLWRRNGIRMVLVVCPKNVLGNWPRQIERHLNVPSTVFAGSESYHAGRVKLAARINQLVFVIVNYEWLRRHAKELGSVPWDMMICDESHRIRNRNALQSKRVFAVGKRVPHKLILTGTFGEKSLDLWAQMRFLDHTVLGERWTPFKKRYLRKAGFGGHDVKFKVGMEKKFLDRVAPWTIRIKADEMFDLPPVTDTVLEFDLTGKAAKAYRDLERDFLVKFGQLTSTTPLAITNMLRLQQLTGGFLGLDDRSILKLEQDKLSTLDDWILDIPRTEKLVVFARFTQEIDAIAALMARRGRSYVIRDGRTPRANLNDWMKFQDGIHPTTYIAQIGSGGEGVDLFAARYSVFYSKSASWIEYEQARKRLDRHGQSRKVTFIHMHARGTIDESLMFGLHDKRTGNDAVLHHLRRQIMAKKDKAKAEPAKDESAPKDKTTKPSEGKKADKAADGGKPSEGKKADKAADGGKPSEGKKSNLPTRQVEHSAKALAALMGMESSDLRVLLRKASPAIQAYKKDGVWDFGTKKNLEAVAKELRAAKSAKKN